MPSTTSVSLKRIKRSGRNGRFRYDWTLRWFQTDGIERSEKIGDASTMSKREAERIRRDFQAKMDAGAAPRDRPREMTLEQFVKFHEQAIADDRKATTRYEYRIAIDHACTALGKDRPIRKITAADVGRIKKSMKASATTKGKTIARLRAMFNRARDWGLVTDNPFAKQPMPPPKARQMRIYQPAEIDAMVEAASNTWWKAFILLAYTSGLRLQELLHLQWRDVDSRALTVTVIGKSTEEFTGPDGGTYRTLEWAPKTHQKRCVPIPASTAATLEKLRHESDGSPYCFLSLDRLAALEAKRLAGTLRERFEVANNVLRNFKAIQRQAANATKAKDWEIGTIHDLRRSYATRMADAVPLHVLQAWLGHSDVSVTAMYYLSVDDRHAEIARAAFCPLNGQDPEPIVAAQEPFRGAT